jgi:nitroimidazol reductase NimA-like FMN-containing flavoprotein (pyridoxamine 5'-phosphate oxidase superfamily)
MAEQWHRTVIQELWENQCLDLLATQSYGRLGVVVRGRPEIFPVNYALDADRCVIFRTVVGEKLVAAVNHPVVFEVDRVDPEQRTGWSVVVHGVAHQTDRVMPGAAALESWLPDRPYLIRVTRQSVTGRYVGELPAELRLP